MTSVITLFARKRHLYVNEYDPIPKSKPTLSFPAIPPQLTKKLDKKTERAKLG